MTTKAELLKKIRLNCNECMGGVRARDNDGLSIQSEMIEGCTAPECAFFDYRQGKDPRPSKRRVAMGAKYGFGSLSGAAGNQREATNAGQPI